MQSRMPDEHFASSATLSLPSVAAFVVVFQVMLPQLSVLSRISRDAGRMGKRQNDDLEQSKDRKEPKHDISIESRLGEWPIIDMLLSVKCCKSLNRRKNVD